MYMVQLHFYRGYYIRAGLVRGYELNDRADDRSLNGRYGLLFRLASPGLADTHRGRFAFKHLIRLRK